MLNKRVWSSLLLAWFNLKYSLGASFLAILGSGFAVLLAFVQLGILGSVLNGAVLVYEQLDFDLILISQKSLEFSFTQPFSQQQLYRIQGLKAVDNIASIYLSFADWKNPDTGKPNTIFVIGYEPERYPFKSPDINQKIEAVKQQKTVLFNQNSDFDDFGASSFQTGTITEIREKEVKVGDLFSMSNSFRFNGSVLMSVDNFVEYFPQRSLNDVSLGLIKLKPNVDASLAIKQIQEIIPNDIKVFNHRDIKRKDQYYWLTSTAIGTVILFGTVSSFLIGAIVVYQILSADVTERVPEYGTLKAIGYRNREIINAIINQSSMLGLSGFFVGWILSLPMYDIMRSETALSIYMEPATIVLVFFFTMCTCNFSAVLASRKIMIFDPADIFE